MEKKEWFSKIEWVYNNLKEEQTPWKKKQKADHIASIINDYEDEEDVKPVRVKQSNTIVYNRIDKAGSTTLISRNTSYPYVIWWAIWINFQRPLIRCPSRILFIWLARAHPTWDTLMHTKRRNWQIYFAKVEETLSIPGTFTTPTLLIMAVMFSILTL